MLFVQESFAESGRTDNLPYEVLKSRQISPVTKLVLSAYTMSNWATGIGHGTASLIDRSHLDDGCLHGRTQSCASKMLPSLRICLHKVSRAMVQTTEAAMLLLFQSETFHVTYKEGMLHRANENTSR